MRKYEPKPFASKLKERRDEVAQNAQSDVARIDAVGERAVLRQHDVDVAAI